MLKKNNFFGFGSGYWKTLSIFGTSWEWESMFLVVHFIKHKYRSSVSNENLLFKLRCTVNIIDTLDSKDFKKKKRLYLNIFHTSILISC